MKTENVRMTDQINSFTEDQSCEYGAATDDSMTMGRTPESVQIPGMTGGGSATTGRTVEPVHMPSITTDKSVTMDRAAESVQIPGKTGEGFVTMDRTAKNQDELKKNLKNVAVNGKDDIQVTGYDIVLNIIGWITAILLIFATAVILRSALQDHASWIVMIVVGVLGLLAAVNTVASLWYTVRNIRLASRNKKS